jgi:hypothetical protein
MSAEIAAEDRRSRRQKPRLLPPTTKLMSAEIASGYFSGRSRQKPRLLPAVDGVMSAEIAAGNFGQLNQFSLI